MITITNRLADLLHSKQAIYDPFNFDFSAQKLKELETWNEDEFALIIIMELLHNIFLQGYSDSQRLMATSVYSFEEIFEELMIMGNRHLLMLGQKVEANYKNNVSVFDSERLRDMEIANGLGVMENAHDSAEILIELYSLLLDYHKRFDWLNAQKVAESEPTYSREEVVQRLTLVINIVFNARIAFQSIVYSRTEVNLNEDGNITLSSDPDGLSLITAANEIRAVSRVNELLMPLIALRAKIKKKNIELVIGSIGIDGELIKPILMENEVSLVEAIYPLAKFYIYYAHLEKIKLTSFENATVYDLLKIPEKLSAIVHVLREDYQNADLTRVNPPFKIDKEILYAYLVESTGLKREIVVKVVQDLTQNKDSVPDFFRYPLMESGDFFMLFLPALNAPLPHPFVRRWLEGSGIGGQEQRVFFRDFVQAELSEKKDGKARKIKWEVRVSADFPGLLGVETRDHFIVLDFICPEFTVNQQEERGILAQYDEAFALNQEMISDFVKLVNTELKSPLSVIITSDIHYSGLKIANTPVLDIILFKNYLLVGKYQRVKAVNDEDNGFVKELYDLPYYTSQDDFETRLEGFLNFPIPILVLVDKMKPKLLPLFPPGMQIAINQTSSQLISVEEEEQLDLSDLDHMLKSAYFLNDSSRVTAHMIANLLNKLFARVADAQRDDLKVVDTLIEAIRTSKRISSAHLIAYLMMKIKSLHGIIILPDLEFKAVAYQIEKVKTLVDQLLDLEKDEKIQLSNFKSPIELSESERKELLSFFFETIEQSSYKEISQEKRKGIYMHIILLGALLKEDEEYNRFFILVGNFVENLNLNQHFQPARDIANETWAFAIARKRQLQGLNLLYKCYIRQKNLLYSAVYGSMLASVVDSLPRIEKAQYVEILFNQLRFFREFGYMELVKLVWKKAQGLKLSPYDDQKFTIGYFNARLSLGLEQEKDLQSSVVKYLNKNFKQITAFEDTGCGPWFALCLNIKSYCKLKGFKLDERIEDYLVKFEASIQDAEVIGGVKNQIEGNPEILKDYFVQSLKNVFEDEYFENFKYDVINLRHIADNAFFDAFEKGDLELILMTSLVYNDQKLSFLDAIGTTNIKLFGEAAEDRRLDLENYLGFVLKKLSLSAGQLLVWIVELRGTVFRLVINPDDVLDIKPLEDWDAKKMDEWVREELPRFYFNSQRSKYYDFAEQQSVSEKLVKALVDYDLLIEQECSELLILKSVDLSSYPDNLLLNQGKLISSTIPICNILNLEHYLIHQGRIEISLENMNAWFPVEGGDATINFGYSEMGPVLDEYAVQIMTSKFIKEMPEGDINVFMAHGTTGIDGFKYFQAEDDSFHYLTKIFGKGIIAILFICSSGNLHEDFKSQDLKSIGQDLILQGYSAVIAPFWKYDVTMAKIWLTEFLSVFKGGYSLIESVHLANRKVTEYDPQTQRMFIEPAGWAAMHLYGNPNIYYVAPAMLPAPNGSTGG